MNLNHHSDRSRAVAAVSEVMLEKKTKDARSTVLHSFQWKKQLVICREEKEGRRERNWMDYKKKEVKTRENTELIEKQILFLLSLQDQVPTV